MKLSKYVSRLVEFELVSVSDINVMNQPIGHVQHFWWFGGEIYRMFNSLLPL
jgi:hypothetical protein